MAALTDEELMFKLGEVKPALLDIFHGRVACKRMDLFRKGAQVPGAQHLLKLRSDQDELIMTEL